jgi:hypothetical protein
MAQIRPCLPHRTKEYVVCEERNSVEAYRRFYGPGYPGLRGIVRLALRHRVTTGIIVLMNVMGLLAYLLGL